MNDYMPLNIYEARLMYNPLIDDTAWDNAMHEAATFCMLNQYVSSIHYLYYYSDDFFFFFYMIKFWIWHEWNWDIPQKLVLHLPDILLP